MSPRRLARTAGVFYLGTIVGGIIAEGVRESLIVSGDANATAQHIVASEALYRWAFAANVLAGACYVVVTVLLYELLKPVCSRASLLAAFFSLSGIAGGLLASLARLGPLVLLGGAPYLAAFDPRQLHAAAYLAIRLDGQAQLISLVFFGFRRPAARRRAGSFHLIAVPRG